MVSGVIAAAGDLGHPGNLWRVPHGQVILTGRYRRAVTEAQGGTTVFGFRVAAFRATG
jgi:hypothetical protein